MSELGQQLFLTSRDQYEAAVRWAFVLVLIGVIAHATIFSRAVEIQKELHVKKKAREHLAWVEGSVEQLGAEIRAVNTSIENQRESVDTLTREWLEEKEKWFSELHRILRPPRDTNFLPEVGEPEAEATGEAREIRRQLVQAAEAYELERKLNEAEDLPSDKRGPAQQRVVTNFVNEHIIHPSFERLNGKWGQRITKLQQQADKPTKTISLIEDTLENDLLNQALDRSQLDGLRRKIDRLAQWREKIDTAVTDIQSVEFRPPEGDRWWGTVRGKAAERVDMSEDAREKVEGVSAADAMIAEVTEELEHAARQQKQATQDLHKRLKNLEEKLESGAAGLAGFGVGWLPVGGDMDVFVGRFPLLLGLLLSIAIIWVTYRRLTLARAIKLLSSEDIGKESWAFLQREYGTLSAILSGPHLALTVVGLAWIGFATVSAARSPLISAAGAALSGLGGAIALATALAYRVYAIRRVKHLNSSDADL